jgi:hypothetical protein
MQEHVVERRPGDAHRLQAVAGRDAGHQISYDCFGPLYLQAQQVWLWTADGLEP